jgi:opacity protein-like surface antigen
VPAAAALVLAAVVAVVVAAAVAAAVAVSEVYPTHFRFQKLHRLRIQVLPKQMSARCRTSSRLIGKSG